MSASVHPGYLRFASVRYRSANPLSLSGTVADPDGGHMARLNVTKTDVCLLVLGTLALVGYVTLILWLSEPIG